MQIFGRFVESDDASSEREECFSGIPCGEDCLEVGKSYSCPYDDGVDYAGFEFRFNNERVTRCPFGSARCTYTVDGQSLNCGTGCSQDECICTIPSNARLYSCVDSSEWYLRGYTLSLETNGDFVTECSVRVEETKIYQETFYQKIVFSEEERPLSKEYRWAQEGVPVLVIIALLASVAIYFAVMKYRQRQCVTCSAELVFSRTQCVLCRFYELPLPEPTLLARMEARRLSTVKTKRSYNCFGKRSQLRGAVVPTSTGDTVDSSKN